MKGETRCEDGRLMRHDPQPDDPDLETDRGQCPDCEGIGCEALRQQQKITNVIDRARALVKIADEFWPDHPSAIDDYLTALIDAIDETGD